MLMHGMSPQYAAPPILVPCYGPGAWDVPRQPWSPPGIARPWPRDEYIFDGGDNGRDTSVGTDWTVYGLDQEDTIGHFDTLDGDTVVVPTNRVPVYAPRFAAVRKISGITLHRETELAAAVNTDTRLDQRGHYQIASTTLQREQLEGWIGSRSADTFRDLTRGLGVHGTRMLAEFRNKFLPYEDFQIIRMGAFENSEKARLAKSIDAALVWEEAAAVQVVVKGEEAVVSRGSSRPEETARAESQGKPRMHIVKVASRSYANPGDVIDFTIRFDNTGTQKIGNVTVIDNLTRRLEYVPDSAQCSVQADFFTQENEGESLVLRWEIIEPMNPGEGGIIRFQCRVR